MGKIRASDIAPDGDLSFLLGNSNFDLSAGGTYETDDIATLASARSHPWLVVEADVIDTAQYETEDRQVKPEDDVLSAQNSVAFDAEEIRKVEEGKQQAFGTPTAIDAGLDQNEEVFVGDVAVTNAADAAAEEEVIVGPEPVTPPAPPVFDDNDGDIQ